MTPTNEAKAGFDHGNEDAEANRTHADLTTATPAYRKGYERGWNLIPATRS